MENKRQNPFGDVTVSREFLSYMKPILKLKNKDITGEEMISRLWKYLTVTDNELVKFFMRNEKTLKDGSFKYMICHLCNIFHRAAKILDKQVILNIDTIIETEDTIRKIANTILSFYIIEHSDKKPFHKKLKMATIFIKGILARRKTLEMKKHFKDNCVRQEAISDTCRICLEDMKELTPTLFNKCQHSFCFECCKKLTEIHSNW